MEAALKGAKQIGFTVISLSVSLIAVFIPLLFMTGIVGRLFREFAITLSVAVAWSAVVSLTLTPMMCARLLKAEKDEKHGRFYNATERMFNGMLDAYDRGLQWVLKHQGLTLMVAIATLVGTIWLYIMIPKGLLPEQDTGLIVGVTDAAQSISFQAMVERQHQVTDIVRKDPDVVSVASFVGAGTVNATVNTGRLYITLKPRDQRKASAERDHRPIAGGDEGRRRHFAAHAGGAGRPDRQPRQPHPIPVHPGGRRRGRVVRVGAETAGQTEDPAGAGRPGQRPAKQRTAIERRRGPGHGLALEHPAAERSTTRLYDAFGQRQVSIIFTQLNQYRVILEVEPHFQLTPASLDKIYVKSSTGQMVPLSALHSFADRDGSAGDHP
jgi:multidrug efflux pump subunit AcrB